MATEMIQLRGIVESQARQTETLMARMGDRRPPRPTVAETDELRSIIDTRVLEKVSQFDASDRLFAEWRFSFEASCGLLGLESAMAIAVARSMRRV